MDLVCHNVSENCEYVVSGIPTDDIVEACRMFAERLGYQYMCCEAQQTHWAISKDEFVKWHSRVHSPSKIEDGYERMVAELIAGRTDAFCGLRQLYKHEPDVVAWDDLKP